MPPKRGEKASDSARRQLIERVLDGTYPPGTDLPGERDLSKELGVARPALREALQSLAHDGWLTIHHGKATQVSDFLREGNLNVLTGLLDADITLLPNFIPDLLEMWGLIAPTYTHRAVTAAPQDVVEHLTSYADLPDRARPLVQAQWRLHRRLIDLGGNPVYGLLLNSFSTFYGRLARHFFADGARRDDVRAFWGALAEAAGAGDAERAAAEMARYMDDLRARWQTLDISAWLDDDDGDFMAAEDAAPPTDDA